MEDKLRKTLREKTPTIVAGATATVTVAILSRFLDTAGTLIGLGVASAASSTIATVYEHTAKKTAETARKIRQAHLQGVIRSPDVYERLYRPRNKRDIPWKRIAIAASVFVVLSMSTATAVEALANRPIAVTGGTVNTGKQAPEPARTTVPAYSPPYTPPVTTAPVSTPTATPAPTATPSSPSPTVTATPSPSPAPSPVKTTPAAVRSTP